MVLINDSDRDWQKWGRTNPYFGVLTDPKYLNANLNNDSLRDFFASGEIHIDHVYRTVRAKIRPNFQPARVLDYGCGVGRLVLPLAQRAQAVIGIDISPDMLEQARKNCRNRGIVSARLLDVNEIDSLPPNSLDFIHSYIVFQHIPAARGEAILRKLVALLAEGGIGAIHLTYADARPLMRRGVTALRRHVSFVHGILNLIRQRPYSTPFMQMNSYSLNRVFDILFDARCSNVHVEFSEHGGYRGAMLYFEKSPQHLL